MGVVDGARDLAAGGGGGARGLASGGGGDGRVVYGDRSVVFRGGGFVGGGSVDGGVVRGGGVLGSGGGIDVPHGVMSARSKCCYGDGTRAGHVRKGSEPDCVHHTSNAFISTANVNLLEEFVEFCKSKKVGQHKEGAQGINANCNDQEKAQGESTEFREKLIMSFGEHLPADVIDELCKLVHENSHNKCRFCMMPTESLILSVLQILLDAGQRANMMKVNSGAPPSIVPNIRINDNDRSAASIGKDIPHSLENKDCPKFCS